MKWVKTFSVRGDCGNKLLNDCVFRKGNRGFVSREGSGFRERGGRVSVRRGETKRNLREGRETEEAEGSGVNKLLDRELNRRDMSHDLEHVDGGSAEGASDPDQGLVLDLIEVLDQLLLAGGPIPEGASVGNHRDDASVVEQPRADLVEAMNRVAEA